VTYPFVIERYGVVNVVRDDTVPGGTKQRVLERWLPEMGPGEYVYASPAEGYAQIALALACRALGPDYKAHIFVAKRKVMHDRTRLAQRAGAIITEVERVASFWTVAARAKAYAERNRPWPLKGSLEPRLLPFGLDAVRFRNLLIQEVREAIGPRGRRPLHPKQVFCAVGSGTLIRCLQDVWPDAEFHAIQVGHKADIGDAQRHIAPEPFSKRAEIMPPFPSCDTYDAKAWCFVNYFAKPGALFWNVAADSEELFSKYLSEGVDLDSSDRIQSSQRTGRLPRKQENQRRTTMTTATAKYLKHEVKVDFKNLDAITIKSWTGPEGASIPQKAASKLVGKTFDSAGKAGRAAIEAVNAFEKRPELPADRRMVFYEAGAKQPINAKNVGNIGAKVRTSKPAKDEEPAAKTRKGAAVEDKSKKSVNEDKAKAQRASRKAGPVTTRKSKEAAAAKAAPKNTRSRTAAVENDDSDDSEELDFED